MPYKDIEARRACYRRYREKHKEEVREYARKWAAEKYASNPEHRDNVKQIRKKYYAEHRDQEAAKKSAKWFANHEESKAKNRATKKRLYWENPDRYRAYQVINGRRWREANPEMWAAQQERNKQRWLANPEPLREYRRAYYARNPWQKIRKAIFGRIKSIMNGRVLSKKKSQLIGCSAQELRDHIESQFTGSMRWDNYGRGSDKWCVDHIRPIASFDMNDPAQQEAAMHFTNLAPLWFKDNCSKSSFYEGKKHWHDKSK